jgi:hypothetical protein
MVEHDSVMLLLGRIDGKLDALRDTMDRHLSDDTKALGAIEERLRGLETSALTPEDRSSLRAMERWRWKVAGMASVIGVVVGALGKYVLAVISS